MIKTRRTKRLARLRRRLLLLLATFLASAAGAFAVAPLFLQEQQNYGNQAYALANELWNLPAPMFLSNVDALQFTWTEVTTDERALLRPTGPDRFAAAWYNSNAMEFYLNTGDDSYHEVALYMVDWDGNDRRQRVDFRDVLTDTLLNSQTFEQFNGGVYGVWKVKGYVRIVVTRLAGVNCVVSGIFVDPPDRVRPTPTPTPLPSPSPTATPTPTPTPTPLPSPTPTPTPRPCTCVKWNPKGKCLKQVCQ